MMVYWCEICNSRPANGVLEILPEGEFETRLIQACTICVVELEEEDWIDNAELRRS